MSSSRSSCSEIDITIDLSAMISATISRISSRAASWSIVASWLRSIESIRALKIADLVWKYSLSRWMAIQRDKEYFQTKSAIFNALIDSIDLSQLATMDQEAAREEIRDIVAEIIALKSIVMSISEQEDLLEDICNDVLGYGPLEPLLARDDIADIMVNGSQKCYIEVA